ncbi:hypothetical protein C8Q74DRAFT_1320907 [Fomes fomentarius]|nr:hypothetical protein C8Q74DRAFT_1320907 [Fomes fomentarius]
MTDLSPFNIKNFAYGKKNMRIIVNDPAIDGVSSNSYSQYQSQSKSHSSDILSGVITESSFLQLFYPAKSINPGQEPQGGADFYATPLDLKGARNVSLEYSVFFPSDFHWVEGGKLPGVYGGHDGCSGGDDAVHCFSTRLMWRGGGVGELYLYAPKDKQTPVLCRTPPETVCSSEYGLSIGRGAFKFRAGRWTRVRQTVVLNTPGEQDGAFTLDVNGERVLDLHGVFYRDFNGLQPSDSTFFGGHESRFATPKDQFTWFKDFSMTINDQRPDD